MYCDYWEDGEAAVIKEEDAETIQPRNGLIPVPFWADITERRDSVARVRVVHACGGNLRKDLEGMFVPIDDVAVVKFYIFLSVVD